jgi:hypothetical protein
LKETMAMTADPDIVREDKGRGENNSEEPDYG